MSAEQVETAGIGDPLFYLAPRIAVFETVFDGGSAGTMARMARVELGYRDQVVRYEAGDALPAHGHDLVVLHTAPGWYDIVTVVHEFAHYWHNKHWPELSLSAEAHRVEAVAAAAEVKFAGVSGSAGVSNAVLNRLMTGHAERVCGVLRTAGRAGAVFPACAEPMLRGVYG